MRPLASPGLRTRAPLAGFSSDLVCGLGQCEQCSSSVGSGHVVIAESADQSGNCQVLDDELPPLGIMGDPEVVKPVEASGSDF